MAPRTLASTWKQYEKQVEFYLKESKPVETIVGSLNNIAQKSNTAKIGNAIAKLFLSSYENFQDVTGSFYIHSEDPEDYPVWPTDFDQETRTLLLNPVGIFQFIDDCEAAAQLLQTPQVRRSFLRYRYFAFLTELKKLPSRVMMFLLVLQQVALIDKIADVETKHGIEEADGEDYLTLLWAFKELESFMMNNNGIDLRSEYKISWYESDWSIGI